LAVRKGGHWRFQWQLLPGRLSQATPLTPGMDRSGKAEASDYNGLFRVGLDEGEMPGAV